MLHARLGNTDLDVSRIALGCMGYGDPAAGLHSWTLDEDASQPFFRQAVELGITFWDTANVYQGGTSEEYVGRAIRRYTRREDIVLATKVSGRMHDGPTGAGLSRGAIHEQRDSSLERLGTDWIDVYFIHRFDDAVPVEETMEALHELVAAGKVRHLGASSMWAWQFAKMQTAALVNGWTTFAAMQDQYNLLKREEEREMIPMCADMGVGVVPYSPQGKGPANPPVGRADGTRRGRRGRQVLRPACRPTDRRGRRGRRPGAQRPHGAGRTGMGTPQPRGRRADRRGNPTAPRGRCRRRPGSRADRLRSPSARGALCPSTTILVVTGVRLTNAVRGLIRSLRFGAMARRSVVWTSGREGTETLPANQERAA